MGLTLEQLIETKTKEELTDEMLLAMQGVSYVKKEGAGEGNVTLSGVSEVDLLVKVKITVEGSLGVAAFRYSTNNGQTYNSTDVTIPSGGEYELAGSGVTIIFENGPGEASDSFFVNDLFSFELSTPTLPVTAWQAGSTVRTIIEKDAEMNEDFTNTIQSVAKGGFLSTAEGPWLDLWLEEMYGTERVDGQVAKHRIILTDATGAGPITVAPGDVVVGTASGLRFQNEDGGTLAQGSSGSPTTLTLTVAAEQRGTDYNVAVGAINLLLSSYPGVSVSNPDVGGGTSILQQGLNRETDAAAKKRAAKKWPTLGIGPVTEAWEIWATDASEDVTRVLVKADVVTPGGVRVILAGPGGPVTNDVVDEVEEAIGDNVTFGSVATFASAIAQNIAVSATVYVQSGLSSAALADITTNLNALFQGGVTSIGEELEGLEISDGTVVLYRDDIIEQIKVVRGVRNINLGTLLPSSDTTIDDEKVPVLSPSPVITIIEV